MVTVGADQKGRWGRRVVCAVLALVYGYTNTLGVSAAESNFWSERRKTADRYKSSPASVLPDAPAQHLTPEQNQLLAQLPAAQQVDFRAMQPTAAGGVTGAASAVVTKPAADLGHVPSWISTLVLPYGTLRDLYIAPKPGAPLVVHIQDAHGILEAQKNMAALLQGLQQERGISLVGLEGASGAFALDAFRAWPDGDVLKAVAETLLKENAIGGPEFAGLTAPTAPLLWGVEDKTRYEDNIQSFKDSLKNKPAVHEYLSRLESAAKDLKARVFSPALRDFDRHAAAYAEGREALGAYVKFLLASDHGAKVSTLNLRLLAEALHWEENLDFKKVERDRQRLVEVLARTLPEKRLNQLVQQSLLYRAGRMGYGEYYRYMRSLCAENGVSLSQYGEINDYITYVLLAEKINRNDLLMELAALEAAVQDGLASTVPQKRLVAASRSIALLQKLTGHAMTPADWLAYEKGKWDVLNVSNELKVVSMDAAAAGSLPIPAKPADFAGLLAPFEGFCSYALSRNNALVDNLLTKMTAEKRPAAVLVAGGFHTDGLTQILRRKDVSYVVVTPRIENIPKDQNYLDVFARDPLPLEQLLTGERINLIDPRPLSMEPGLLAKTRAAVARFAALLAALTANVPLEQAAAYLNALPGIRNASVSREGEGRLRFVWEWAQGGTARFSAALGKAVGAVGSSQVGSAVVSFLRPSRSAGEVVRGVWAGVQTGAREMSILPSVTGLSDSDEAPPSLPLARWAHFWEWVYHVPFLALFVRPVLRRVQPRLLESFRTSPLTSDQAFYRDMSAKDLARFVGETRWSRGVYIAGSVMLMGTFLSGAPWALVPASLVWSVASGYVFAVAHVKKTGGQKVWAFAFGAVLAAVMTLPLALHAAGGFPFDIPLLGRPDTAFQTALLGWMGALVIHFAYNAPIRVAKWMVMNGYLTDETLLNRAVLWLAQRSTMAIGDDGGRKKIPLHRLPTGTIGAVTPDLSQAALGAPYLYNELYPSIRELARLTNRNPENLIAAALSNALPGEDLQSAIAMYKKGVDQNVIGKAAKVKQISIGAFESALREEGEADDSARTDDDTARVLVSQLAYSPVRAADMMLLLKTALTDRSPSGEPARRAVAAVAAQMLKDSPVLKGFSWDIANMSHLNALLDRVVQERSEGMVGYMVRARMAMPGGGALTSAEDMMQLSRELLKNTMDLDIDSVEKTAYKVSAAQAKGDRPEQQDRYVEFRYKIPGVGAGRFLAVADGTNGSQSAEWVTKNAQRLFESILQEERGFSPVVMERLAAELHEGSKEITDVTTFSMVVLPDDKPQAFVMVLGDAPVRIVGKGGDVWDSGENQLHHALVNPVERERLLKIPGVSLGFVETDEKGRLVAIHPINVDDDFEVETAHLIYNGKPMFNVTAGFGQGADAPFMARTAPVQVVDLDADSLVTLFSDGLEHDDVLGGLAEGKSAADVIEDSLLDRSSNDNRTLLVARMLRGKGTRSSSIPDGGDGTAAQTPAPSAVKDFSTGVKPLVGGAPVQLSLDLNKTVLEAASGLLLAKLWPSASDLLPGLWNNAAQVLSSPWAWLQALGPIKVLLVAASLYPLYQIGKTLRYVLRTGEPEVRMRNETLAILDLLGLPGTTLADSHPLLVGRGKGLVQEESEAEQPLRKAMIERLRAKSDAELEGLLSRLPDQPKVRVGLLADYLRFAGESQLAGRLEDAWGRIEAQEILASRGKETPASKYGLGGVIYPLKNLLLAKPRFWLARSPSVARFMETGYDLVLAPLIENGLVGGVVWVAGLATGMASPDLRWVGWTTFLVLHLFNLMSKGDGSRAPPFWGWTLVPAVFISSICIFLNLSPFSFDGFLVHFAVNFLTFAHYKLARGVEGRLLDESKAYSPRGFQALLHATGLRWLARRLKFGRRMDLSKELHRVMGLDRRMEHLRFILDQDERNRSKGGPVDERKRLQDVEALLRDWPDILGDERNLFDKIVDRVTDGNSSIHTLSEQVEDDLLRRGGTGSTSLSSTALYTALFTKLASNNGIPNVAAFPDHFKSFLNRILVDTDTDLRDSGAEGDAPSAYFGTDIVLKGLTPEQVKDRFDESIPKALKPFIAKYEGDVRRHWESVAAEEGKKRGMTASARRKLVERNVKAFRDTLYSYVFYSSHRGINLAKMDDPFVRDRLADLEGPGAEKKLEAWEKEFEREMGTDKARLEMYSAQRQVSRNRMQELVGRPGVDLSEAREDYNNVSKDLDDYLKTRRLWLARWGRVFVEGHWRVKDSKVARKMASRAAELLIVDAITELKARSVLLEQAFQQEGLEGDSPLMAVIREAALTGDASAVLHGQAVENVLKRLISMSQDHPELLTEFFERLEDGRIKRLPAYNSETGRLPRLLASTRKIFNPKRRDADKTYVEHMVSLEKALKKNPSSPEALRAFLDAYDNYRTAMDETHLKGYEDPREAGVTKLEYGDELAEADANGTLTQYREHLAHKKNEHEAALHRARVDPAKDERAQKMDAISRLQGAEGFFILMRRYGDETLLANRAAMDSGSKRPSRAPMSLRVVAVNSRRMVRAVWRSGGFTGMFSRAWRLLRRTSRLWASVGFITAFAEVNGLNAYMAEFGTDERDSFRSGLMKSYIRHGEHFRNRNYHKFIDLVNKDLLKLTEDPETHTPRRIHMTVKYKDERMPVFIPVGANPDSNDGVRYIRNRVGQYFVQYERGRAWRPIRRESIPDVEPAKRVLSVGLVFHRSPVPPGWLLKMFHFLNDVNALQKDTFFFNKAIDSDAEEIEHVRQVKKEEEEREAAERKTSSFPPVGGDVKMPSIPPPSNFTLSLPLWEWVFAGLSALMGRGPERGAAYARSSEFKVGVAPWLELPLLPGLSALTMLLAPSLPLWAAVGIGAALATAAHGRQTWRQAAVRFLGSYAISFLSIGLGSYFPEAGLDQFIFRWAWSGLAAVALHAVYNAAVPDLYRLTLSAPAMPSPRQLSAYGGRDLFTLLRGAQAKRQLTVELLGRVVDEIENAGFLPGETAALRAAIKARGLGATEEVASAVASVPSGTLSDDSLRKLLTKAGLSVEIFNPSYFHEIEEALRVPEIGRAVSRLNVYVLKGSLPMAVPGAGMWESGGILTSWDDAGVLNFYVHENVLLSWRKEGNGRPDYLRNALIMAFFYKTAVARGVKENGLLPTLDLPALDELYKRKKQRGVNNITRELARRGRVLLSRAPKTAVHGYAAEIEHDMYMSHPQRSPSEQTHWARTLQKALTAARQAYGSRTVAAVGRRLSLYEHAASMAVRAAEWGAGEDAVLAMLYQPLYLRNPEEAGRVLRGLFPADPARAGRILGFILRLENVVKIPYNPPEDAAKAIQYHMGFVKAHLGKDSPEELLRLVMVERSFGLLSAPTAEDRMSLYRDLLYIYTPLAERLGKDAWAAQVRDEAFAVMEPGRYAGIQRWVKNTFGMTHEDAVEYVTQMKEAYQSWLDRSGIPARVYARVKGIYSSDIKDYARKKKQSPEAEKGITDFFGIFLVFDDGVEGRENDAKQFLRSIGDDFKEKSEYEQRYASYSADRFTFKLKPVPDTIDGMTDIDLPVVPGGSPGIVVETAMFRHQDFLVYKLGRAAHWMYNLRKEHAKFTVAAQLSTKPQFDDPEDRLTGNFAVDVREWIDSDPDVYVKVFSDEDGAWSDVRSPQGAIAANLVAHRFINPHMLPVDKIWLREPDGMGSFLDEREIPLTEPIPTGSAVRFSWRDPAVQSEGAVVEAEEAFKRTNDLRTRLFLWKATHGTEPLEAVKQDVRRDLPMESLPKVVARISWKMGFQDVDELVTWLATRPLTERSELIRQIDQIAMRRLDVELVGNPSIHEGSLKQTIRIDSGFDRPGLRTDVRAALKKANLQVLGDVEVKYYLTEVRYIADVLINQAPSSKGNSLGSAQKQRIARSMDEVREQLKAIPNDPLVRLSHQRPLRMVFRIATNKDLREKVEWALGGVGLEMETRSIDLSQDGEGSVIRVEVDAPSGLVLDQERISWMERTLAQRIGVGPNALQLTVEKGTRGRRPSSAPPASGAAFSSGYLLVYGLAMALKTQWLPQIPWLSTVAVFAGLGLLLGTAPISRKWVSDGPGLLNVLWARWKARRAAGTDDKSLFRREAARMLLGLAPVAAQGLNVEDRVDAVVKAAKGNATLILNADLAHDEALVGKALYPLVEAAAGVDVDAVVNRLNALPEGGVRTVILAVEDRAVAAQIRARLGQMPVVEVSRPVKRQNEGDKQAYYYVDDVLDQLPESLSTALDAALASGQAALPLIPLAGDQWNASDRFKAAVLILQAVGGKLLRVSMQAMEDIRKEMFALIQA